MKRLLLLGLAVALVAGCEKPNFLKSASELATPVPATPRPTPMPKPTPKPGDWMWDKYQNPLDQKKPKR